MTRNTALALTGLVLLGAAAPDEPDAQADAPLDCIDLSAVINRHAVDDQTIRFDLIGGRTFHNRLAGRCPGLRDSSRGYAALAFEPHGRRLCRGDLVRVIDSSSGRAVYRASIPCPLGDFVPVAREP